MDNKNLKIAKFAADKIHEKVEKALDSKEADRRWFWELLQNAKDTVVKSKGKVDVRVVIDYNQNQEPFVRFEHNGGVFKFSNHELKFDDPECLILPNSGKIEEDETQREDITGQFGTGFLSTHILSLKILVESIFLNKEGVYADFSFTLDRDYTNQFDLTRKVEQALNEYENNFTLNENPNLSTFHTKFTYYLNKNKQGFENALNVVKKGVEGIEYLIPFVLAFCKEINSVEIFDNITTKNTILFSRQTELQKQDNQVQIIQILKKVFNTQKVLSDSSVVEIVTCSNISEHIDLAIEIQKNGNSYKIAEIANNLPTLFCTFPLIGSEKWRYPVVVNCTKFYPTEPRDGVKLKNDDKGNQTRIVNTINPYKTLLDYAINQKWENLHWLVKTDYNNDCPEWTSEEWYKGIFKTIRQYLLSQKIVVNSNRDLLELSTTLFPSYYGKEKLELFWDICYDFIPLQIPQKQDILIWNKIINADYSTWQTDFKYDLERLLKDIENENNLLQLAKNKFNDNIENTFSWLNKVIDFIFVQAEKPDLLQKYTIIPNKNGVFKKVGDKADLLHSDIDAQIPNEIITIYESIANKNWLNYLLHPEIVIADIPEIPKYGITHIAQDIDLLIENKNTDQAKVRSAVYQLISFYSSEFTADENNPNWRRTVYQLAKDLDNSVPEIKQLSGLLPNIWEKAEEWLFPNLSKDIANTTNIENLRIKLNKQSQAEALNWLNHFIDFYETKQKSRHYSDKPIFPNQEGNFKLKGYLNFDKINHKELKNVLIGLGGNNYYDILLDEAITAIKNFEQEKSLTIKQISNEINEQIKDKDLNQSEKFRNAIYELVSFLPNNDFSERKRLLSFANAIYLDKIRTVENAVILPRLSPDFDFSLVNEWIVKALVTELHERNLEKLRKLNAHFETKTEVEIIKWLDDFISFVAGFGNHKSLLEKFAIIPNQNNNFKTIKFLKKDDAIPNDLKEIANAKHIRRDWNDWLLHKGLVSVNQNLDLFTEDNTLCLKHIADEIDSHVRDYKGDKHEASFSELIFLLNQSETVNRKENEKYFSYFLNNKNMLIVGTLGDIDDLKNVATILQDRSKLAVFANMAESGASAATLEKISDALQDADKLKGIINFLENASNNNITSSSKQPKLLYEEGTGSYDTSSEHNKEVGNWGEEFINTLFVKEQSEGKIESFTWHKGEGKPYDFTVKQKDKPLLYVDAKATEGGFDKPIRITKPEIQEIFKQGNNYMIYRVYNLDLNKSSNNLENAKHSRHKPFKRLVRDFASFFDNDYPNGIAISLEQDDEE